VIKLHTDTNANNKSIFHQTTVYIMIWSCLT